MLDTDLKTVKPLHFPSQSVCVCVRAHVHVQSCLTLRDPMDYSPPGSSVHGHFQARVLEWVSSVQFSPSVMYDSFNCSCLELNLQYLQDVTALGLPWWLSSKESTCEYRRLGFDPWVGEIPWRRKWQPTPVSLPEKSHGQRSLEGYSPWGHKESDMTE